MRRLLPILLLLAAATAWAGQPHFSITLAWQPPNPMPACNLCVYLLYVDTSCCNEITNGNLIYNSTNTFFTVPYLLAGTYYFVVYTWCDGVFSPPSNEISIILQPAKPPP
jgi:hypothetical protein